MVGVLTALLALVGTPTTALAATTTPPGVVLSDPAMPASAECLAADCSTGTLSWTVPTDGDNGTSAYCATYYLQTIVYDSTGAYSGYSGYLSGPWTGYATPISPGALQTWDWDFTRDNAQYGFAFGQGLLLDCKRFVSNAETHSDYLIDFPKLAAAGGSTNTTVTDPVPVDCQGITVSNVLNPACLLPDWMLNPGKLFKPDPAKWAALKGSFTGLKDVFPFGFWFHTIDFLEAQQATTDCWHQYDLGQPVTCGNNGTGLTGDFYQFTYKDPRGGVHTYDFLGAPYTVKFLQVTRVPLTFVIVCGMWLSIASRLLESLYLVVGLRASTFNAIKDGTK